MPPPTTWYIIKHRKTGELSIVNSDIRSHQVQLWAVNCMDIPSFVLREFETVEHASDFLIEMQRVSAMINDILKKDEEKFG